MELTGYIKLINPTQELGSNGFKKRDLVITTEEQYSQHILIQFVQDKTAVLDSYSVGEKVKIGINLRGREWINPQGEAVYFNTIQGWKIEKVGQESYTQPPQEPPPSIETNPTQVGDNTEDHDDLPF